MALAMVAVVLGACSSVTLPHDPELAARSERPIVVLVPGVTGVELVDPSSGRRLWGRGRNLIAPRDGGRKVAIPLSPGPPTEPVSGLVPGRVIEQIRLGPITKPIYGPIVQLMQEHGWQRGDLDSPAPADDFFLFSYDWRRDNSLAANRLADLLERLSRSDGGGDLGVSLICQSNGAHICRYLVKYGSATLSEAEDGDPKPLEGVTIERLILVGNANGGSLRMLRFLNGGRKYVTGIGRSFRPETFFTFEALFQDLPVYSSRLFVDSEGRPLEVDLHDPDTWRRYGWSIYGADSARRLARNRRPEVFADAQVRERHLADSLALARRLHTALERDLPVGETRYYLIQNQALPTPGLAVLRESSDGWQTLLTGDKALRPLLAAEQATAPGDGHATLDSQLWLAPAEIAAFGAEPFYVEGAHFEMILQPPTLERLLRILADPPRPAR
jgi:hypothetical protein